MIQCNEISHGNRNYVLLPLWKMMKSVVVPYILGGKVPKATVLCRCWTEAGAAASAAEAECWCPWFFLVFQVFLAVLFQVRAGERSRTQSTLRWKNSSSSPLQSSRKTSEIHFKPKSKMASWRLVWSDHLT